MRLVVIILSIWFLLPACTSSIIKQPAPTLFNLLPADYTGIDFINQITEDENVNPLQYENSYNGGGVAIGDLNNDGLDDIYLTSNRNGNHLYINHGNFKFEDVTVKAGAGGRHSWTTGVTMADVNGDGLLDLYVCHSGNLPGPQRANELFINKGHDQQGVPLFAEQAQTYGLADSAFSNHAAFFDYDLDGDLDMILLNHSPIRFNNLDETAINYLMNKTDSLTGIKLYRNDDAFFHDVTKQSGIRNARLNFNLGVSVSDINNDGFPDIYISNDYLAPDCLYINNTHGGFRDEIEDRISITSQFSMGNDVADINNDGLPDIYTLDMLPEDNRRQKLLFSNDNYELFDLRIKTGLHPQYMRNMLHLNTGNAFSEIGQLAGVSNTDWSWAPLFADLDNDGWKDLFVTNGYLRDYTNMDFQKFMGQYLRDNQGRIQKANLLELVKKMPSSDVRNCSFKNTGGVQFSEKGAEWGLDAVSNSNGAAYADLDNDGDLDLVVNNINKPVFIYRNNAKQQNANRSLRVKLSGDGKNRFGIGARVQLFYNGQQQVQEQLVSRGFQSSVSPVMVFGTGKINMIDSLVVVWPDQKRQVLTRVASNKEITLQQSAAQLNHIKEPPISKTVFTPLVKTPVEFLHQENHVNDFKRQPLLINSLSYDGPCMVKADLNGDGKEDLFIGGASGAPGAIFIQGKNNTFIRTAQPDLESDALSEDVDAAIFDANGDGYADLLVVSGGYDNFQQGDNALQSRLYLNDGSGKMKKNSAALPPMHSSSSAVAVSDINGDGYPDLFLAGRVIPGRYPEPPASYILLNDGKGTFYDATSRVCPALAKAGMFTSAVFADLDQDGRNELITAGEWMPVQVWKMNQGKLEDKTAAFLDKTWNGWWNTLQVKDINGDGKPDIIAGNNGTNCQWHASDQQPVEMVFKDFDDNGAVDPIFCYYIDGKSYPYVGRDELLEQISAMRTRFPDYKSYSNAQLADIFTPEELKASARLFANSMETKIWVSNASGKLSGRSLPLEAQFAPVFAISVADFNKDGKMDIILGGNVHYCRVKMGMNESSQGQLFLGDGTGSFKYVPQLQSGLRIRGDVRSFTLFNDMLLVGMNGNAVQAYKINNF